MTEPGVRIKIMSVDIDCLDQDQVMAAILASLDQGKSLQIVTANPEIVLGAGRDPEVSRTLSRAELVTADGVGLRLAGRFIHGVRVPKVTGVDLAVRLLKESAAGNMGVFLVGGRPGVADAAAQRAEKDFNAIIAGVHHGYFDDPEPVFEVLAQAKPRIVLVGMGSPKQELFINQARQRRDIGPAVYMGVGGVFDVLSGTVKRAPKLFQATGTEWLYRVATQPSRLKRLKGFPFFILWVLKESLLVRLRAGKRRA